MFINQTVATRVSAWMDTLVTAVTDLWLCAGLPLHPPANPHPVRTMPLVLSWFLRVLANLRWTVRSREAAATAVFALQVLPDLSAQNKY